MRPSRAAIPLLLLPLLTGCASAPAPSPEPQVTERSLAVRWVADSAEYRAIFRQTYSMAQERLLEILDGRAPGQWAVALDADETVISNLPYQVWLEELGEGHSPERWTEWVDRRAAEPLPGAVEFLERVRALGGRIAIVTNRDLVHCPATEDNLRAKGVPFDVVLCRTPGQSEKEPRWERVEEGSASPELPPVEILLWLGDNIRDFPGLDQDATAEELAAFGERFFVLPNPLYGSWQ